MEQAQSKIGAAFAKTYNHRLGHISQVVYPYPTHGDVLRKTADQFWQRKLLHGVVPRLLKAYVKWFR